MVIHDLKHPTEALVEALKQVHQMLVCTSVELITVKQQNEQFQASISKLKSQIKASEENIQHYIDMQQSSASFGYGISFDDGASIRLSDLDLSLDDAANNSISSVSEKSPKLKALEIADPEESEGWLSDDILDGVDEEKEEIMPTVLQAKCNIISRKNKLPSPRAAELVVKDLQGDVNNLKQQLGNANSQLKRANKKNRKLRQDKRELKIAVK